MIDYIEDMPKHERQYNDYIREHRENIVKGLEWFEENLPEYLDSEIYRLVENHDISKYSEEEFSPYAEYFYLNNIDTADRKQEIDENFEYAWLHHIHNNPHHWQYWILINDEDGTKPLKMPKKYVIEMILDWWSFSWRKNNLTEIFSWYKNNEKKGNLQLHPETESYVKEIFKKMEEKLK